MFTKKPVVIVHVSHTPQLYEDMQRTRIKTEKTLAYGYHDKASFIMDQALSGVKLYQGSSFIRDQALSGVKFYQGSSFIRDQALSGIKFY